LPDAFRRFIGQADPPLGTAGLEQAQRLAERLRDVPFDAVYSSDLKRCLRTAEVIAGAAGVGVRPDPRLREIDTGLWEGLSFDEARVRYPLEYAERERDLVGYRFPGGESFRDLRERVVRAFLEIVEEGGGHVLVCAHKGANRVLFSELLGLPPAELFSIKQDYGCVNLIEITRLPGGGRRIEVLAFPTSES
jgi:broad specificity phosphatase PhoE